jgi:hypothetical protein
MSGQSGKFEDIFEVLEVDPEGKKFDKGGMSQIIACYVGRGSPTALAARR